MLNLDINNTGLVFTVNVNGVNIPVSEWINTDDCIYYLPLEAMVDNGFADFSERKCTIPFEYIYQLDAEDMALLGVPEPYDKALRLRSDGMLNSTDFRYKLDFLSYVPDGDILQCERIENIVSYCNRNFLLSVNQYRLVREIEKFNSTPESERTTDYNLRCFARIKNLAFEANCELDSYLENENVHVPGKIKIEVGQDDLGYTIDPSVGSTDDEKFTSVFDKMR